MTILAVIQSSFEFETPGLNYTADIIYQQFMPRNMWTLIIHYDPTLCDFEHWIVGSNMLSISVKIRAAGTVSHAESRALVRSNTDVGW